MLIEKHEKNYCSYYVGQLYLFTYFCFHIYLYVSSRKLIFYFFHHHLLPSKPSCTFTLLPPPPPSHNHHTGQLYFYSVLLVMTGLKEFLLFHIRFNVILKFFSYWKIFRETISFWERNNLMSLNQGYMN